MANKKYTQFVPKSARALRSLIRTEGDCPAIGTQQEWSPRLPTRIVPKQGNGRISAQTLYDTIYLTQRIVNYVGYEVVNGPRVDFSDLRTADDSVFALSRLMVEPFEEGSFVIPASLREDAVPISIGGTQQLFLGTQVVAKFQELMNGVVQLGPKFLGAIGLVQAIEDLGRILRREASVIEFYPSGPSQMDPVIVNERYIDVVQKTKRSRQDPKMLQDDLTGRLVAVDIESGRLKLKVTDRGLVSGSFTPFMRETVIACLNKHVRLLGVLSLLSGRPHFIQAIECDPLGE